MTPAERNYGLREAEVLATYSGHLQVVASLCSWSSAQSLGSYRSCKLKNLSNKNLSIEEKYLDGSNYLDET